MGTFDWPLRKCSLHHLEKNPLTLLVGQSVTMGLEQLSPLCGLEYGHAGDEAHSRRQAVLRESQSGEARALPEPRLEPWPPLDLRLREPIQSLYVCASLGWVFCDLQIRPYC